MAAAAQLNGHLSQSTGKLNPQLGLPPQAYEGFRGRPRAKVSPVRIAVFYLTLGLFDEVLPDWIPGTTAIWMHKRSGIHPTNHPRPLL